MAIARVTGQDASGANASTKKLTVSYATAPTKERLLVATVMWAGSTTPTVKDAGGEWTLAAGTNTAGGNPWTGIFYKVAAEGQSKEVSLEIGSATSVWLSIYEYSGTKAVSPKATSATSSSGVEQAKTTGASVSASSGDLVFSTFGTAAGVVTGISVDSSFSLLTNNGGRLADAERVVSETTTYAPQFSWTTNRRWDHATAVFNPAEEASGETFTETGSGTIPVTGTSTEELGFVETGSGEVSVAGTSEQAFESSDSPNGSIEVTGTSSELAEALEEGAGSMLLIGTKTEEFETEGEEEVTGAYVTSFLGDHNRIIEPGEVPSASLGARFRSFVTNLFRSES